MMRKAKMLSRTAALAELQRTSERLHVADIALHRMINYRPGGKPDAGTLLVDKVVTDGWRYELRLYGSELADGGVLVTIGHCKTNRYATVDYAYFDHARIDFWDDSRAQSEERLAFRAALERLRYAANKLGKE